MKKIIILTFVIIALTGCQQKNQNQTNSQQTKNSNAQKEKINNWPLHNSDQLKISFNYPTNWKIEETDFGSISINPPKELIGDDVLFDMGIFTDENIDNKTLTQEDVSKFNKHFYNDPSFYEIITEKKIEILGSTAPYAIYKKKGGSLKKVRISFLYQNQIYGLRFFAPEKYFDNYVNTFTTIVDSISSLK